MTEAKRTRARAAGKKSDKDSDALKEMIASKAYEIYERSGREDGKDFEHWLEAEKIVRAEMKKAK
jgi:Protein of unknown function (DUF2934)